MNETTQLILLFTVCFHLLLMTWNRKIMSGLPSQGTQNFVRRNVLRICSTNFLCSCP